MISSTFQPSTEQENLNKKNTNGTNMAGAQPKHQAVTADPLVGATMMGVARALPLTPAITPVVELDDKWSLEDEAVKMLVSEPCSPGDHWAHWAKYKWPTDEEALAMFYAARKVNGY